MPKSVDTYAIVAPDGTVTFDFTGHVHAEGLDLNSSPTGTPPTEDKVRWIRALDDYVVTELASYSIIGTPSTESSQYRTRGQVGDYIETVIASTDDIGSIASSLASRVSPVDSSFEFQANYNIGLGGVTQLIGTARNGSAEVTVSANALNKTLLNTAGASSYVQDRPGALRQVNQNFSGSFATLAAPLAANGSAGFLVTHGLGKTPSTVMVTPNSDGWLCSTAGFTSTQFTLTIKNLTAAVAGTGTQVFFGFIAIG